MRKFLLVTTIVTSLISPLYAPPKKLGSEKKLSTPEAKRIRLQTPPTQPPRMTQEQVLEMLLNVVAPAVKPTQPTIQAPVVAPVVTPKVYSCLADKIAAIHMPIMTHFFYRQQRDSEDFNPASVKEYTDPIASLSPDEVQKLIEFDNDGESLLFKAAKTNNPVAFKILLNFSKNLDINLQSPTTGDTLLMVTIDNIDEEFTRILLTMNPALHLKNNSGETALHKATKKAKSDTIKLLLNAKNSTQSCNVNEKNKYGETPLHIAVQNKYLEVIKLLIKDYKADLNVQTNTGDTPLHYAAAKRNSEIVTLLINENANKNIKNNNNHTAQDILKGAQLQQPILNATQP